MFTKPLFALAMISLTSSCRADSRRPDSPDISAADSRIFQRDKVQKLFETFAHDDSIGGLQSYQKYQSQAFLAEIHPWFSQQSFLEKAKGNYKIYELPLIPGNVRGEILSSVFDDSQFQSGFGFLQASFWEELFEAQDLGIKIATVQAAENTSSAVFGVNFLKDETIALAVFSDISTLRHELQHSRQWKTIAPFAKRDTRILKESCLDLASTMFAEINATYVSLPLFKGSVERADFFPAWQSTALVFEPEKLPNFAELRLLNPLFAYPKNVTLNLSGSNSGCPTELIEATLKAHQLFENLANSVRDDIQSFFELGSRHYKFQVAYNSRCQEINEANVEDCTEFKNYIDDDETQIKSNRDRLSRNVNGDGVKVWEEAITLFQTLPKEQRFDLCTHALGASESGICSTEELIALKVTLK